MSSTVPARRPSLPSRADAALGRARLSVVPRLRSRAPKIPFITLVSVILLGGVIGLLLFNTSMQQASFEATALQQQADTLTAREQALQSRTDELNDPSTIAGLADKRGMVIAPAGTATVDLDTATVTGTSPAATKADRLPTPGPVIKALPTITEQAPASTGADAGTTAVPSDPVHLGGGAPPKAGTAKAHDGSDRTPHRSRTNQQTRTSQLPARR